MPRALCPRAGSSSTGSTSGAALGLHGSRHERDVHTRFALQLRRTSPELPAQPHPFLGDLVPESALLIIPLFDAPGQRELDLARLVPQVAYFLAQALSHVAQRRAGLLEFGLDASEFLLPDPPVLLKLRLGAGQILERLCQGGFLRGDFPFQVHRRALIRRCHSLEAVVGRG